MKALCVPLPHYQSWIIGLLGWDRKKASAYVWRNHKIREDFKSQAKCLVLKRGNCIIPIIFTETFSSKPEDVAIIAHECIHAVLLLFDDIGQGVSTTDHEHFTYLVQYIFQKLLEKRKNV